MLLDFRKPPYVLDDSCVSYSGKYKGFHGHHFHAGHLCYVMGAVNGATGEIVARHYTTKDELSKRIQKDACSRAWEQLKAGLLKPPEFTEEKDDNRIPIENYLSRRPN